MLGDGEGHELLVYRSIINRNVFYVRLEVRILPKTVMGLAVGSIFVDCGCLKSKPFGSSCYGEGGEG